MLVSLPRRGIHMKTKAIISALALIITAGAATATEPLVLFASRTKMMQLAQPPGTIVVGNPSIADVTVNGSQVFLHGRNYGSTNIMIFDAKGDIAHDFEVVVQEGAQNHVTIYKAGASLTYACINDCQPTLRPGDMPAFTSDIAKQFKLITGLATGQQASDGVENAPAPPAPPAQ